MKQKLFTRKRSFASIILLAIVITAVAIFIRQHKTTNPSGVKFGATVPSQFTFTGVSGWWQGATNKTSLVVFHRSDGCFVSAQHNPGTISADEARDQKNDDMKKNQGYLVNPLNTQTLTLQTTEGQKRYQLYQSSVISPSQALVIKGGQEYAYLPIAHGHIYIEAYCDTSAQLSATIPVLQALKFDENKVN